MLVYQRVMFQCGNLYDRDLSEPAIGDIRINAQALPHV